MIATPFATIPPDDIRLTPGTVDRREKVVSLTDSGREYAENLLVLMLVLPLFGGQIMIWWSAVIARITTAVIAIVLTRP